jgi:hypothetical protein
MHTGPIDAIDRINIVVAEMKAMLGLVTWLGAYGESGAAHDGIIMVMQHTLLRHVETIEGELAGIG